MKQFNLDEYLKNPTKPIVTRDGGNVRIVCTDMKDKNFPIVALIKGVSENEKVATYSSNGRFCNSLNSPFDLFFVSEKKEGWINMYKIRSGEAKIGQIYNSKEEAEAGRKDANYILTAKIEWEE